MSLAIRKKVETQLGLELGATIERVIVPFDLIG
jgi:hypothetical protein